MFNKQKRDNSIKGVRCADDRKQRVYIPKEDAILPAVSTEALMTSCVLDANDGQDVATVHIPNAFMQADMDDTVHLTLIEQWQTC
jgi:hypothetical protein